MAETLLFNYDPAAVIWNTFAYCVDDCIATGQFRIFKTTVAFKALRKNSSYLSSMKRLGYGLTGGQG